MRKKLFPIHPGEQLREELMIPLGLSSSSIDYGPNLGRAKRLRRQCAGDIGGALLRVQTSLKGSAVHLRLRQRCGKLQPAPSSQ